MRQGKAYKMKMIELARNHKKLLDSKNKRDLITDLTSFSHKLLTQKTMEKCANLILKKLIWNNWAKIKANMCQKNDINTSNASSKKMQKSLQHIKQPSIHVAKFAFGHRTKIKSERDIIRIGAAVVIQKAFKRWRFNDFLKKQSKTKEYQQNDLVEVDPSLINKQEKNSGCLIF